MNYNDPGIYSTSCNIDYTEAEYALNMFMRHHLRAFIAEGETVGECLNVNAPALLLSYMRPIVANITSSSIFPAYHLPFVNL